MKNKSVDSVLLHICCAPCANQCIDLLRMEGFDVTGFWFNPNIHPFTEYRERRNGVREYAKLVQMPLIEKDDYGLRSFVKAVADDPWNRCGYCYEVRLEETAREAAEKGFGGFTTSLLISPYQQHEVIVRTGKRLAEKYGVRFIDRDFRPSFRAGQDRARELGIYMQKYCGCIFSEEERYRSKQIRREKKRLEEALKNGECKG